MSKWLILSFSVMVFALSEARAQPPAIDHSPVGCAAAEKFPRLEARFNPAESVALARVVFQGQTSDWYSVVMKPEGAAFAGVLPKPMKSLKSFRYYIEVTDTALGVNRTTEYSVAVVGGASACQGKLMAGALGSALVVLQSPAGVAALPAGFASAGVAGGASAGAAGASATAGGGGLSSAAVLGVVGGAGAAAAAVVVAKGKEGDDSGGDSSTNYAVTFDSNDNQTGVGLVECGGPPGLFFSIQNVTLKTDGSFDALWGNPVIVHAVGQATSTTFQAAMTCTNGARSGSLSASGTPSVYSGTFEFGNSRGSVTVTRR